MSLRRAALIVLLAALPAAARVLPAGIRPFRTYGTEAGMGNLAAMRLAQDAAGFLWVATQDGVYRYDGNRFARFGLGEGLPSSYVPNDTSLSTVCFIRAASSCPTMPATSAHCACRAAVTRRMAIAMRILRMA